MKRILFLITTLAIITANRANNPVFCQDVIKKKFVKKTALNANFATMKLLGNSPATQAQIFQLGGTSQIYSGGGLRFIQPGIELATIMYLDDLELNRGIVGAEMLWLSASEKIPNSSNSFVFAKHNITLLDFFVGYHYAFWDMKWQNAKLYAGPEIMLNMLLNNDFEGGTKYYIGESEDQIINTSKDLALRLGARLRAGVEGQIRGNWYVNSNFSIGIYNLLFRDAANGELFNSKNEYETQEQMQFFYNFNIGIQYKL